VSLGTALPALALFATIAVSPLARVPERARIAQAENRNVIWTGIFTDAEAERGKAVFQEHCASCHDPNVQGEAPLLAGDVFMRNWEGHSVGRLYTKILDEMPANNPGSVTAAQKLDALAYILHENGFPPGSATLSAEPEALERIPIVPEGGSAAPRTGAMVVVVGCLARGAQGEWQLTNGTDPVVTTLAPGRADKPAAAAPSPGTRTVELLHVFPSPDSQRGHRIEAKGFLLRQAPDDLAINVVSLRSLSPACP
jgi:mono/diheme cytochrome c family protein